MLNKFKHILFVIVFLCLAAACTTASIMDLPFDPVYMTDEFALKFTPAYPLEIGKFARIHLETYIPVKGVDVYLYSNKRFKLQLDDEVWTYVFEVHDGRYGWQPMYVYLWPIEGEDPIVREVWYRVSKPGVTEDQFVPIPVERLSEVTEMLPEVEMTLPEPTPEAEAPKPEEVPNDLSRVPSREAEGLTISGSQIISFNNRSVEGSLEGYATGLNQERILKISIAGKADGTEVDANFLSTSTLGVTDVSTAEEIVSIRLKRGDTEAYFGDFTGDISDVEFAGFNKVLSGVQVTGDYDRWGFKAIASSPKGESKLYKSYGNNSQGPYSLGSQPVVINSDRVYVDDVPQERGRDYDIDYNAGTVTFKSRIISDVERIVIYYDYRSTLYQHSTYALRAKGKLTPEIEIGATYLNDSDSLADADSIYAASSIEPRSHFVIGTDGSITLGELLKLEGEVALSEKDPNILAGGDTIQGKAGKVKLTSKLGPFSLTTRYKKIGSGFEPIAQASPKLNLLDYGASLDIVPGFPLIANLYYDKQKYLQDDVEYEFENKGIRTLITPEKLPQIEYTLKDQLESNDPITGQSDNRLTNNNTLQLTHQMGTFQTTLRGNLERRLSKLPSEEAVTYKKLNLGLSTVGIDNMTLAANVNLEDKEDSVAGVSELSNIKGYSLNLSMTPRQELTVNGSINYADNSETGITNVTELSYKYKPNDIIMTDGSLSINSLDEAFGDIDERVTKNVGSFKLEARPSKALRLRYYYKPNNTVVNRTGLMSYNNETQQFEANILPSSKTFLGYSLKKGTGFTADKTDFPTYERKQSISDTTSTIYSFKAAPSRFLSTEINYIIDEGTGMTLTATPDSYTKDNTSNREVNITIKTPLSEKFAVDTSYSYKTSQTGTGESQNNQVDSITQTASLKLTCNVTANLTLTGAAAYTKTTDLLAVDNSDTYTITPTLGFIYRYKEKFRLEGAYSYARSFAGASTEKTNYSLKAKYAVAEYINLSLKGEQEISKNPDYKTTDISGYIEITL
ncbi:MAG: hypothetical protein KKH83_02125 [Candidatus Margulisbacteria bacterium]|nr:hypothetical protein [Candidatus Margulisiibacteriota bacterium]